MLNPDGGTYHVHSRCVRRAWLCGKDAATGRDFTHRRFWIESQIHRLSNIFAVSIHGYAVMSNHYHIVLSTDPQQCAAWQDEEVIDRWLSICPGRRAEANRVEAQRCKKATLLANPEHVAILRDRLSSLSWFMRFINEPLARLANREDNCTGRFWEGRFKSQLLLNEAALLACMVYVDLNPVRAGLVQQIPECSCTSISHRIRHHGMNSGMTAFGSGTTSPFDAMAVSDYMQLLEWTKAQQANDPAGTPSTPLGILREHLEEPTDWLAYYLPRPGYWRQAVGSAKALKSLAKSLGRKWIRRWSPAPK